MLDVSRLVGSVLDAVDFKNLGLEVSWCEVREVNPIFKSVDLGISTFENIIEFEIKGYVNYDIYLDVVVGSGLLDLQYCKIYKEDDSKIYNFYRFKELRELQDYLRTQFM